MSTELQHCFVAAATWWDADVGPPQADLLTRAERNAASFSTRILAHVLGKLAAQGHGPSATRPWIQGIVDVTNVAMLPGLPLRRALGPSPGPSLVHAGVDVVPMALLEAMGHLFEHESVLVAFAHDATPPHHEALASAWVLTHHSPTKSSLFIHPPALQRTFSHLETLTQGQHPLAPIANLARANHVGQPTTETIPASGGDRPQHWRIELGRSD